MCPHETNTHTRVFQRQCLVSQLICLKTIQMISVMEAQIRGTPPFASHTILDHASPSFFFEGGSISCFFFPLERRVEGWGRGGQRDRPLRTPLHCLGAAAQDAPRTGPRHRLRLTEGAAWGRDVNRSSGAPRTASALEIPGDGSLERRILRPYPKDSDEAGGDQGLHFPGPHG